MVLEYPENFVGEIEKITLVSMPCFYLCPPDNGVETEQKLTINSSGKVTFTSKEWTMPIPNPTSGGKWRKANVSKEQAKNMLETIITPFRNYELRPFCTDVGNWLLTAFAVSWIQDLNGKDENQTWFASDPFDIKKWLNK